MHAIAPHNSPPTLAVVIINWNATNDTMSCLAHVAQWRSVTPRVWVVDNASSPTSLPSLRTGIAQALIDCTLIENEANLGFAGGTNCGLRAALAAGDWPILLLNNDARIEDGALHQLMTTFAAHPEIGWLGPPFYHGDKVQSAGRSNPVLHLNNLITTLPDAPLYQVDFISGSVALVRTQLLREVGLLDEDFFFNTEVADHCRRSRAAGYLTMVDGHACAHHDLDRSSALRSTLYTYYLIRNRFIYIRKHYCNAMWPLTLFWAIYSLLLSAKLRVAGQHGSAQAVYLGVIDGIRKRWGGQNRRVLAACGQKATPQSR